VGPKLFRTNELAHLIYNSDRLAPKMSWLPFDMLRKALYNMCILLQLNGKKRKERKEKKRKEKKTKKGGYKRKK
jgi:hypothetical protein